MKSVAMSYGLYRIPRLRSGHKSWGRIVACIHSGSLPKRLLVRKLLISTYDHGSLTLAIDICRINKLRLVRVHRVRSPRHPWSPTYGAVHLNGTNTPVRGLLQRPHNLGLLLYLLDLLSPVEIAQQDAIDQQQDHQPGKECDQSCFRKRLILKIGQNNSNCGAALNLLKIVRLPGISEV